MKRRLRRGLRRGWGTTPDAALFADDVLSAVTRDECRALARHAVGKRVLEFGAYLGRSTIAVASTASVVHSIDPHNGGPPGSENTLPEFVRNLERYGVRHRVVIHVGVSHQIASLFAPSTFDFVFIDAAHQRPYVDYDLALATSCLRPGGVIAFHDYATPGAWADGTWHPFTVREAVDEFADAAGVSVAVVDSTAFVAAPSNGARAEASERWNRARKSLPVAPGG